MNDKITKNSVAGSIPPESTDLSEVLSGRWDFSEADNSTSNLATPTQLEALQDLFSDLISLQNQIDAGGASYSSFDHTSQALATQAASSAVRLLEASDDPVRGAHAALEHLMSLRETYGGSFVAAAAKFFHSRSKQFSALVDIVPITQRTGRLVPKN